MTHETDADRRWREGVEIQNMMHRVEERVADGLREHVGTYAPSPTLACPICNRTDITIKKDGTLRVHGSKKRGVWPPRDCDGSGQKPKEGSAG